MSEAIMEIPADSSAVDSENNSQVSTEMTETKKNVRKFVYNGMSLDDPAPEDSTDVVRNFYANMYPELINAAIKGPTKNSLGEQVYTFAISLGNKG